MYEYVPHVDVYMSMTNLKTTVTKMYVITVNLLEKARVMKMVAIKNMKMPKCCRECNFKYYDEGEDVLCCALEDGYISDDEADEKRLECCPLVEIEPLTDTEKRLFLSAVGREEDICKKIDSEKELNDLGVKELAPIVRSIRRKVKKALWA